MPRNLTYSSARPVPAPLQRDSDGSVRSLPCRYARSAEIVLCWAEDNRLLFVADDSHLSLYLYDAGGERAYKLTGDYHLQNTNGQWFENYTLTTPTLYASPYLVVNRQGYTKHYYAGAERICSKIGGGGLENIDSLAVAQDDLENKHASLKYHVRDVAECLGSPDYGFDTVFSELYYWKAIRENQETDGYWYHPDHLGSSSWITFSDGSAVQHLHYLPWGEDFVDQRSTSWNAMYTFSAKEKDTETGYSYFGSRYYNSDLSIWLSVDPMASKYPSLSPYVYCADNPVKLVDPNGDSVIIKIGLGMKESDLQEALNDLRIAAPNLNLIMEGDKLLIGEGGEYKTQYEKQLAEAILSDEFKSELTLEVLDVGVVGSYYGTCKEGDQYISHNRINLFKSQELEEFWGSVRGCGLMHEITEGFEMGKIAKREGLPCIEKSERTIRQKTIGGGKIIPDDKTGPQYHLYEEGHSKSTPPPGNRNAKPKNFFKPVDN